jgi:NTE family protein
MVDRGTPLIGANCDPAAESRTRPMWTAARGSSVLAAHGGIVIQRGRADECLDSNGGVCDIRDRELERGTGVAIDQAPTSALGSAHSRTDLLGEESSPGSVLFRQFLWRSAVAATAARGHHGGMRSDLDLYNVLLGFGWLRERGELIKATIDPGFLLRARRALFPLPIVDRPKAVATDVLPPFRRRPVTAFKGKRVALIVGGGAGACVSLVGVRRAFEEAGIEPALITACSGGTIWGSMWAAGLSADQMAEFSLSWRLEDYLDVQWTKVPRYIVAALKGFTGVAKGEAIQRTFDERFAALTTGEFRIPLTSIVYDMDRGVVDYFGSASKPDLTIGRLVRIAIALPLFIESVEVDGHLYVDGGIIDLFPAEPILRDGAFEHVFGVNFMLPPQLEPEDITGWKDTRMGFLKASRQAEQGFQLEFAHRARRALGDRLTVIDAADHRLLRGPAFYDIFIDRSRWPELIRAGHEHATRALDAWRSPAPPRAPAAPRRASRGSSAPH